MTDEPRAQLHPVGCLLLLVFCGVAWGAAIAAGVLTYRIITG